MEKPATSDTVDYVSILREAFETPVVPERGIGCGRIYVCIPKEHAKGVAKAAKTLDRIFQAKAHYNMRNALYVGYDNCDGRALARGTKIVEAFKAAGVQAYREEHGD